jgi:hypothetical protein
MCTGNTQAFCRSYSASIIDDDDLFASAGGGKPPDAGEELAQAFEGFGFEEEEGEEDDNPILARTLLPTDYEELKISMTDLQPLFGT